MASNRKSPISFTDTVAHPRRSFTEALRERYVIADDDEACASSGVSFVIKLDIRGKPKDTSKGTAELGYLRNAGLSECAITHAGLPECGLKFLCPNVVDLDLSANMISDWNEIIPIICSLPNLKYVDLSRNALVDGQDVLHKSHTFPKIENLVLNQTSVTWKEVSALCRHLTSLKDLHICGNGLRDIPEECIEDLTSIDCLRMNDNLFIRWEEIWKLGRLPNLKTLIMSGNPIQNMFYVHQTYNICIECRNKDTSDSAGETDASGCDAEICSKADDDTPTTEAGTESTSNNSNMSTPDFGHSAGREENSQLASNASECNNPYVVKAAAAVCQNIINEVLERVCQRRHSINTDTVSSLHNSDVDMYVSAVTDMMDSRILVGCNTPSKTPQQNSIKELDSQKTDGPGSDNKKFGEREMSGPAEGASGGYVDGELMSANLGAVNSNDHQCQIVPAFSSLENLYLSKNNISNLDDIESLSRYPSLHSLRIKDTKISPGISDENRRKIFVACLPNITVLNGSEVTSSERSKSERYFIRHFKNTDFKPKRFEALQQKHGKLDELVTVDLSQGFCEWAEVTIVFENSPVQSTTVHVVESVGQLRKMIAEKILFIPARSFKMYHLACGPCHPEGHEPTFDELNLNGLPLSRYNLMHGDEIHIEKTKFSGCSLDHKLRNKFHMSDRDNSQ